MGIDTMVHNGITYVVVNVSYFRPLPDVEVLNDKKNPKMWARWFREFLEEILPQPILTLALPARPLIRVLARARSIPIRFEWKMKLWKQTFAECLG